MRKRKSGERHDGRPGKSEGQRNGRPGSSERQSNRQTGAPLSAGMFLAVLGLAMMGFGICRGEMAVVMEKAVNICMECIGIG